MATPNLIPDPISRRLRIFSFDPGLASQYDMAGIGEITIKVPWEELQPGPIGEYIEVVDVDPASGVVLPARRPQRRRGARPGRTGAFGDPTRNSISRWSTRWRWPRSATSSRRSGGSRSGPRTASASRTAATRTVRSAAAHLSARAARPQRLLQPDEEGAAVRLLSGRHQGCQSTRRARWSSLASRTTSSPTRRRMRCSTACTRASTSRSIADVLAFHEAFADIVALFQHFSYPGVLRDQISPDPRQSRRREHARPAGPAVRHGPRAAAAPCATRFGRHECGDRQMGAAPARCYRISRDSPSRTIAARSWSRRCSARS